MAENPTDLLLHDYRLWKERDGEDSAKTYAGTSLYDALLQACNSMENHGFGTTVLVAKDLDGKNFRFRVTYGYSLQNLDDWNVVDDPDIDNQESDRKLVCSISADQTKTKIRFNLPDEPDFLALCNDGTIKVKGKTVANDAELVCAMRAFLGLGKKEAAIT